MSNPKEYNMKKLHIIIYTLIFALMLISAVGCESNGQGSTSEPEVEQVKVFNGSDEVWIDPEDGVAVSTFKDEDFSADENGRPVYCGDKYDTLYGVDVSVWQGDIDWQQVKDDGIDFAIIRIGARGYGVETGHIIDDERFEEYYEGAKAAGLMVGVYFFSQATDADEATEEAEYVLDKLRDKQIDLPVYFDWEHISYDTARTQNMNGAAITDCALAFCGRIEEAGLAAGIYMYSGIAYYDYELSRLTDFDFWCASIGDYPFFYYAHNMWQYSFTGSVAGISTDCDLNMMFVKK